LNSKGHAWFVDVFIRHVITADPFLFELEFNSSNVSIIAQLAVEFGDEVNYNRTNVFDLILNKV